MINQIDTYLNIIKNGGKIICDYEMPQEDSFESTWTREIWYEDKSKIFQNKPICCKYENTNCFMDISNFEEEDFRSFFRDIAKMQEDGEAEITVEKGLSTEWTPEVVYKVYRNDDLDTLPTPILEDMLKHLNNKLIQRLHDKIDNINDESEV